MKTQKELEKLEDDLGFVGLLLRFKIRPVYIVESNYQEIERFDTIELATLYATEYSKTCRLSVVVVRKYIELENNKSYAK